MNFLFFPDKHKNLFRIHAILEGFTMVTDDNGTDESTIEDILNLGKNKVLDTAEELLEKGADGLYKGLVATENFVEKADVGLTGMRHEAREEQHIWYQMWTTGTEMFTDSAKGLLGSKPSELKSKSTLGYIGGILGGGALSVLSIIPVAIVEESARYAARKIAEKK